MKTRTIILLFFGIFLLALLLSGCGDERGIVEVDHTLKDGRTVVCLHYDLEDELSCDWLTATVRS